MIAAVQAEGLRTLYLQIRNTAFAAVVVTTYMVLVSLPFTDWRIVASWTLAQAAVQLARLGLIRSFNRRAPPDTDLPWWGRAYILHQIVTGAVWGSAIFLFGHLDQPITIALTLCCLYSISAGGVPAMAYYPPAIIALVTTLHGAILIRMLLAGGFTYAVLGVATALFGLTMIGFCLGQARAVRESFRIRFENRSLLEALTIEKAAAEGARRSAEAASMARSQFLAAASHDLRQPLYALSLYSASLDELALDTRSHAVVSSIQNSIGAMERLFNDLLDLSKLQSETVEVRLGQVRVDDLFDHLSQVHLPQAMAKRLDLRFRSAGEIVLSDGVLLEQVLSNLIANALRYTLRGGVLVACRRRRGVLKFEVWDTGIGISQDKVARIFDEFVQLDNPQRDRRKGLGLGLAIGQQAARLLGGRIEVTSTPGRGSRFSFVQQLADVAEPWGPITEAKQLSVPQLLVWRPEMRLLVIEDDPDVQVALQHLLGKWDIDHVIAGTGKEALEAVASCESFAAILTDQRLPGPLDGLATIAALRAACPGRFLPAALLTGEFDAAFLAEARANQIPVVHKPVRPHELATLIGVRMRGSSVPNF